MSAEDMLRDLHRTFEPLRGGWNGVPRPVEIFRKRSSGSYALVITRNRWESDPQIFRAPSAAGVIYKAWMAGRS